MSASPSTTVASVEPAPALWAPLTQLHVFRFIWLALLAENICSWLMDVTNGWVMTSLSPSPLLVALVQTATTFPVLMLALPAGALADILKRRSILLVVELGLVVTSGVLAGLSWFGMLTPELLLALIFLNGMFLALGMPAWQSLTPEVVSGPLLGPALLLGGVAVNASRAVGPALAGALLAYGGPTLAFGVNVLGYLFILAALRSWPGTTITASTLPVERVLAAMTAGLRYALNDVNLKRVLVRFACVSIAASAFWATLPLTARQGLGMGSVEYGLLMACFGAGAVLGAWLINRDLATANINTIVAFNTAVMALCMVGFAVLRAKTWAYPLIFVVGTGWMALSTCFAVSVQSTVSAWARGRALSLMLIALQGSLAIGSFVWGVVAQTYGVPTALATGAALLCAGLAATFRLTLAKGDLAANSSYGLLPPVAAPAGDTGLRTPVMVQIDYRIEPGANTDFIAAMKAVGAMRQRNGATAWNLFEDMSEAGRWIENFEAPSFVEHERQRERLTKADQQLLAQAYALHRGGTTPPLTRWLGPDRIAT
jgi:MFS family permease